MLQPLGVTDWWCLRGQAAIDHNCCIICQVFLKAVVQGKNSTVIQHVMELGTSARECRIVFLKKTGAGIGLVTIGPTFQLLQFDIISNFDGALLSGSWFQFILGLTDPFLWLHSLVTSLGDHLWYLWLCIWSMVTFTDGSSSVLGYSTTVTI